MTFNTYGKKENPSLLLIPGLGVSFEIFLPLIELMKDNYYIVAVGIDGFLIGKESHFTSVINQAGQIISYVQGNLNGHLDVAYGLNLSSIRTISMCFWTNARKCGHTERVKQYVTDIRMFIPTSLNPSKGVISTTGTAQRKRL